VVSVSVNASSGAITLTCVIPNPKTVTLVTNGQDSLDQADFFVNGSLNTALSCAGTTSCVLTVNAGDSVRLQLMVGEVVAGFEYRCGTGSPFFDANILFETWVGSCTFSNLQSNQVVTVNVAP
jgi:hypothetical protein